MITNPLIYPNGMIIVHDKPYRLINVKSGAIYPINKASARILSHIEKPATTDTIIQAMDFDTNSIYRQKVLDFINKLLDDEVLTYEKEKAGKFFFKHTPTELALEKIQFEITTKCNFSCTHCYNRSDSAGFEMDTDAVIKIIKMADRMGVFKFDLTGGEFFTRKDALKILDLMAEYGMAVNIFTNAYMIDDTIIEHIKDMDNIRTFYISLDDCRMNRHDEMRNKKGAFLKTIESIKRIKEIGKQVIINCTVTISSIEHMQELYNYFTNELGVKCRMSPLINMGRGENLESIRIDDFVGNLRSIGLKPEKVEGIFKNSKHDIYTTHCGIGENMLFLTAEGDILPCPLLRNDPFRLGNILKDELLDIWSENEELKKIYNANCSTDCPHKKKCKGGCKARAYFNSGRFDGIDPVTCSLFVGHPGKA